MTRHGVNPRRGDERQSQLGLSLVEVSVYLALSLVIGIPLTAVTLTVSRSSAEGTTLTMLQERNRIALQRIAEDYRPSLAGTTVVAAGGKALQFVALGGFDGATAQPGRTIRYELRPQPGVADTSVLVRMDLSTGQEVVIGGSILPDSSFAPSGSGVILTLATFGRSHGTVQASEVRRVISLHPEN